MPFWMEDQTLKNPTNRALSDPWKLQTTPMGLVLPSRAAIKVYLAGIPEPQH